MSAHLLTRPSDMHLTRVGAKFHHQATLLQHGFPVPAFVCLTADAFRDLTRAIQPTMVAILHGLNWQDRSAVQRASAQLRELVTCIHLPDETIATIFAAMDDHLPDAGWVSVRACMVSQQAHASEDSAANPFAGISETFLYVPRTEVIRHVLACWASAFAEKALLYRLSQGMDPTDVAVAVGIQRMVFGERSFVMFTCDPKTAARDTVIVAGHGIGEGVVQEAVPVDHYFVGGKSGQVRQVLTDKHSRLSFDAEQGHGLCRSAVDESLRHRSCLSDDEVVRLHQLGQQIEKRFDWPQDIEGTIDAEGRIHILQARPVSLDFNTLRVWTGLNIAESYPGVSAPLTYSVARLFYRVIFRDIYDRAGASDAQLRDHHHLLDRMIGYVNGRIYYNLNAFYLLHGMVPIFPMLCKAWENMVGLKSSYFMRSGEAPATESRWQRGVRFCRAMGTFAVEFVRLPSRMRHYKAWWKTRATQSRAVLADGSDPLTLTEEFHRLWRDVGQHWGVTLVNDAYIFSLFAVVNHLLKRWGLDRDPALLSNLLCGDEEVESVEVFLSVLRIAEHIRARPALAEHFVQSDDATLLARYRARLFDADLLSQLDQHIERFGDRSMQELKIENPSLRDDPTVLLKGIRRFVQSDLRAEVCRQDELAQRAQAEQALDEQLGRWSLRKPILRWALRLLREVIAHRENARYCRSELFGICRDIFRAQAQHLVQRGVIDRVEDVHFLTIDEIMGYTDGTGVDEQLQATVAQRRVQHQRYLEHDVPETLTTLGALRANVLTRAPVVGTGEKQLQGLGSSMGVARGTAQVILDPNAVDALPPGAILVTRETDPGWLFLMLGSAGMVVERGSMLSHTAITGRKFGIPTVVGVDDACQRIQHGSTIEIDGGSGLIQLVD